MFGCYPDNKIKKLSQVKQFKENAAPEKYGGLVKGIHGFAVEFPYEFLNEENLDFKPYHLENLMPRSMWI